MTPRQKEVFMIIDAFWRDYGYGPSIDEILMITGTTGRGNVQRIIKRLCELGHCVRLPHLSRTVRPKGVRIRS